MMNTQRKYRCRKCGIDMPAGPYIAPEACGACQLAANAEGTRRANGDQDLLKQLRRRPYSNPSYWMLEAADTIERLKAYTAAYNKLLAERVEIECLRGLAVRAWRSLCAGDREPIACDGGLTSGDIAELTSLTERYEANANAKQTDK